MDKQKKRKNKSNKLLKKQNITINEGLPYIEDSSQVKLKSLDEICKKALSSLFAIQVACDINNGENYEESVEFFKNLLKKFNVEDSLNSKEKRIFDGTYSPQDVIDLDWTYEAYWALLWALGFVDDISNGGELCDCGYAIKVVISCSDYEDFKSKCKLRDVEEILDLLDLYYRYHWAVVDNAFINQKTKIGNLISSNVLERRRGLEWLVSTEEDWYDISLDT